MKKRVADILVDTLIEKGVTDCFAVVGGGAMHLDNALGLNNQIHKIFNHHEQACAMAAEAYARLNGRLAAVCVTSGPGATNAITGVMGAWQDSLPMIVISGQVRYAISVPQSGLPLRYRGVQEFEIIPTVKNMTKYAVMLTDPLEVRREVCKAIDIAMSSRRGPVWLDVPLDVQSAVVDTDDLYAAVEVGKEPEASQKQIWSAFKIMSEAKRPVVLAGSGITNSGCNELFRKFIKTIDIPVIGACIASDVMYSDYKRFYGMSGSIGLRVGNFIIQNADVILSVGCSLGFQMSGFAQEAFAPNACIIAVDADENEVKKPGLHVDYLIHSSVRRFIQEAEKFSSLPMPQAPQRWIDYCDALKKKFSPFSPGMGMPDDDRVCAYRFWYEFERMAPDDYVCALGNNTANSAKLQIGVKTAKQRILANKNCGSMGYDLPAAIGAAALGQKIICVTGDGSIMMNLQELQTIRHNKLPVKVIVFSNDGYNAIRQTSLNFFGGFFVGCNAESGISFPSLEKVADTFGFAYHCCRCNGEISDSLAWLFEAEEPVILEVEQRINDPVIPKVKSRQLPDGSILTPVLQDMFPFLTREELKKWMEISRQE